MAFSQRPQIRLRDFFDTSKPWILVDNNGSFLGFFDFVPASYRYGPWNRVVTLALAGLILVLLRCFLWILRVAPEGGWMKQFDLPSEEYVPFNRDWFIQLLLFVWMVFICCNVMWMSPLGGSAWISFTLWSWTTVTIRAGLCVMSPFVPSVRIMAEMLRFPGLMSASVTTVIWNAVLMPAIALFFLRDTDKRKKFLGYMTNFRLTQLHVFNLLFAAANGALLHPVRPLHLGDLALGLGFSTVYMAWYFLVLDRLGIHLYPIFSPRTLICLPSLCLSVVAWLGSYQFWKWFLEQS